MHSVHHTAYIQYTIPPHHLSKRFQPVQRNPAPYLRVFGSAVAHVAHACAGETRGSAAGGHQEGDLRCGPRGQILFPQVSASKQLSDLISQLTITFLVFTLNSIHFLKTLNHFAVMLFISQKSWKS